MTSIADKLSVIVGEAFAAHGLARELGVVRVSDRPDLAQFQCNGAMAAAKAAGKPPREVAQAVLDTLQSQDIFSKLEIAGPGFINLNVTDEFLAAHLAEVARDEALGVERAGVDAAGAVQTIVLDYGGPNIAKAMHVGHLRASIIGDALRRICKFAGYNAIGDVHMGDWGTPMGQIISELEIRHPEWPYFDENFTGEYPAHSPITMQDLEEIYPTASNACKEDEARREIARRATVELQNGRRGYRALWQHFIDVSIAGMKANFDALGVHFDLWKGEASVHDLIAPMVEDLRGQGLAVDSDGAVVVPVEREDDKKEVPPLILYKSDGAVMYGTTDLATIVDRMQENNPVKIIYATDQRQALHFEQVFRAARLGGIAPDGVELIHAGFGTMNGTDGKPFKTRAGGVMKLEDLIAMGLEKAQARLDEAELAQDMDEAERADIAHKVAIAAIKFADLQNNRVADYVFDLDRLTSFEGKTGPYLLYQAVRIKSLLRRATEAGAGAGEVFNIRDEDRALALMLSEFPDHFGVALRNYTPHVLCDFAYKLAQSFSSFYSNCHILSETDEALRASRLALCALTYTQLELILGLLGIEIPERM
jgi:arginyl-tRNA synthetase